jgi:hypothetical protein
VVYNDQSWVIAKSSPNPVLRAGASNYVPASKRYCQSEMRGLVMVTGRGFRLPGLKHG